MTSRLRFPSERSCLRKHPEPPDPSGPYRTPFEHDRDRIIHSRAFRRLAAKTQVTTLPDSNHCRTRLTHTLEVSQVARTVGKALGLNVDLVEALALAHDIGHPPFGHTGEAALNAEMQRFGSSFDHNFHALRIVEHFETRYASFRGLNLTFEVREGLIKHSRELDPEDERHREYLPSLRPLLEAQLIDGADEIAYLTADMEDAVEECLLSVEALREGVPAFAELYDRVTGANRGIGRGRSMRETQRQLVGVLVRGLVEGTVEAVERSGVSDINEVRQLPRRIAVASESASETMSQIRQLLTRTYYSSNAMRRISSGYAEAVRDLFRYYEGHPEALPNDHVEQLGKDPLHDIVCDYIAGMTDVYFLKRHEEVLGGRDREKAARAPA